MRCDDNKGERERERESTTVKVDEKDLRAYIPHK